LSKTGIAYTLYIFYFFAIILRITGNFHFCKKMFKLNQLDPIFYPTRRYSKYHTHVVCFTGIQLADELGFKESLSSLEQNSKRRSVNGFPVPGSFEPLQAVPQKNNHAVSLVQRN